MTLYYVLACTVIALHGLFILWVIFGAAFTRGRRLLSWLHIVSLLWGVWIEAGPWPCPLTWAENWLELRAGQSTYQGSFLLHYLNKLVYPDVPSAWLTWAAIAIALLNTGVYLLRFLGAKTKADRP